MTDLNDLQRELIQEENRARARLQALERVKGFVDELDAIGMVPVVSIAFDENQHRRLKLDLNLEVVDQHGMDREAGGEHG